MVLVGVIVGRCYAKVVAMKPEQLTILKLLADGLTVEEIAKQMAYSSSTIEKKLKSTLGELDCPNRLVAVVKALRMGLIT